MGDTDPDSCVADPALSRAINVESTKTMIDDLLALGVKIIFTSTEFVFDGNRGMYNEKDQINPILLYGEQKAEIERYLQTIAPEACILRLAKVYGLTPSDGTLFTGMFDLIQSTTTIRCASDQVRFDRHTLDVNLLALAFFDAVFAEADGREVFAHLHDVHQRQRLVLVLLLSAAPVYGLDVPVDAEEALVGLAHVAVLQEVVSEHHLTYHHSLQV